MNGQELKKLFKTSGKTMKQIAEELDMTPQALNTLFGVEDLKSGLLEKVYSTLGLDPFPRKESIAVTGNERSFNSNADDVLKTLTDTISSQQHTIDSLSARIAHLTDRLLDSPK